MKLNTLVKSRWLFAFIGLLSLTTTVHAQPMAPQYEECRLDSIFPNGGQRGTSVKVEFKGHGAGLTGPKDIIIDGPPGITVQDLKQVSPNQTEAMLVIAPDAPLGRRWLRVLSERSGLTNFAHFVVGNLPENSEAEPNNDLAAAQRVETPAVINGQINPAADLDVFRFTGRTNQKIVAAIAAHALDVHGQYKNYGVADFSLELLDASGRTLVAADDTLGFDPALEATLPADGEYAVRIQLLNYAGFPEAVYRLTLGDVPYVTGAFPPGVQRGSNTSIKLLGMNLRDSSSLSFMDTDSKIPSPLRHLTLQDGRHSGLDVPIVLGDAPETIETEPNDERATARELAWPITVNAGFQQSGDADWYRVKLAAQQKVWIETTAHRFIRSPADTQIQVFDDSGKQIADNDDEVFEPGYEAYHDFKTTDSKLLFVAPAAGDFFVKVTEQSGIHGPRTMYRLTVQEALPDFRVTHFPDAVPVWGPGSTASVLVRVDRFAGCDEDIKLSVIGLPDGWSARSATSLGGKGVRPYNTYQLKVFLTITAPAGAQPGTCLPFQIVGRMKQPEGSFVERMSLPLSLLYTSDTGFFRVSPVSRVAVAKPQGPWLESMTSAITVAAGGGTSIPVRVWEHGDAKEMPIVVNIATAGVACGLMTPQNLAIQRHEDGKSGIVDVPLKVPAETYPGTYAITVAQTWRSDIRIGMPGPCTPLIYLTVTTAK